MKNSLKRGFTLLELITVMAIMMILMGMAMLAFVDWGRGAAMRSALMSVRTALSQARQHAVTYRVPTCILCTNSASPLRGYYLVTNRTDGIIGTTNYLPEGIAFGDESDHLLCSAWTARFPAGLLRKNSSSTRHFATGPV